MTDNIITLTTDKERAAELTAETTKLLKPVLELMNFATRDSYEIQFNIGLDIYGRYSLQTLRVVKRL
jgi:hypothetical protein